MNVAQQYPARTDDTGVTWYRPAFDGKSPPAMWGWTSQPEQAHPDYLSDQAKAWGLGPCPHGPDAGCYRCCDDCNYDRHRCHGCGEPYMHGKPPSCDDCRPTGAPEPEPTTRKESPEVTELAVSPDGEVSTYARYSEFMHYPLPPIPEQINVEFDGFKRYKLPAPTTGKMTAFTRATTVAGTTPDTYNLGQWKIREKVRAVLKAHRAYRDVEEFEGRDADENTVVLADAFESLLKAFENDKVRDINAAIDFVHDVCGGADSRELGGAVHDWLGELDAGRMLIHQLPDFVQPYAHSYQDALARAGLVAVPEYIERLVLNTKGRETIAGRLDRIYLIVATGERVLGDVKTSKSLEFGHLEYGIQLATYGYADLMLALDRSEWEPMPAINEDFAVIVHLPSDQPERSQVVPFDLYRGGLAYVEALDVRETRRDLPKTILGRTTPIPERHHLRYVAARQALQAMTSVDDAMAIKETYEDVWTDDLDEFGAGCFELLSAPVPAN